MGLGLGLAKADTKVSVAFQGFEYGVQGFEVVGLICNNDGE